MAAKNFCYLFLPYLEGYLPRLFDNLQHWRLKQSFLCNHSFERLSVVKELGIRSSGGTMIFCLLASACWSSFLKRGGAQGISSVSVAGPLPISTKAPAKRAAEPQGG
ncbi:hypothetical protein TWF569_009534 [Orbilia oligospora]|nr:hypothetical protein TWF706_004041 [Orbilia oligospora]KAF3128794.1 hypothetical protein TWF594_011466 [Orbilia oligospora]KAF3136226.1 hypothetical protein TWF569_009534 [Orbilia oligospora]